MIDYITVDVFTDRAFGGNPLAVIPDARGIGDARMQAIATEFNYSETTFVLPPDDPAHDARVRIFTPTDEIPFAGHPNVGTAFVLGRQQMVFGKNVADRMIFEENAGLVQIDLLRDGSEVIGAGFIAPQPLELGDEIDAPTLAACVSLPSDAIVRETHPPRIVSVGLPFAVAELMNLEALAAARPDTASFAEAGRRHWHRDDRFSVFVYVRTGLGIDHLRARMFAPLSNIPEDPATGSASAALSAYLASIDPRHDAVHAITIEQGVEMGRPSAIGVEVNKRDGCVKTVRISGHCVAMMQGTLALDR
ncbi:PhzF family phenazine biosynthesis protein [Tardiphaga sp.]|uniref:PhzF family phenazine biosynthesis protein n=1 Tax=Tardiphaga sp. TaxID=1926292 RepID=UPI002605EE3C|nr:PhzF family phenazine biosynthesis protein [Tardiphaga sp.]MDB5620051.1 Phenazine biosynthesis protein PhzF like [Tardiphaga sp.]